MVDHGGGRGGSAAALVHELLHEVVELLHQIRKPLVKALKIEPVQEGEVISEIGVPAVLEHLPHYKPHPPRLLRVPDVLAVVPLPGDRHRQDVEGQLDELGLQVHRRGLSLEVLDEEGELGPSGAGEGGEAGRGEDVEGGQAAEVAPVVAVGGDAEGRVVVAEVLGGEGGGPVREDDVVCGEAFLGGGGGGDDEDAAEPEFEGQNGAVFGGEGLEGLSHGLFEEVEMAYYWKRRWGWRLVSPLLLFVVKMSHCQEKNCNYGEEDNGFHFCVCVRRR